MYSSLDNFFLPEVSIYNNIVLLNIILWLQTHEYCYEGNGSLAGSLSSIQSQPESIDLEAEFRYVSKLSQSPYDELKLARLLLLRQTWKNYI